MIRFDPIKHTYTDISTGVELMSVTTVGKLFNRTDWDHNVKKSASQKYLKTKYDKLKKEWEEMGRHILDPAFIDFLMPHMNKTTFNKLCKAVKDEWAEKGRVAREKGTIEHAKMEEEAITKGYVINPLNDLEYPTQPHGRKDDGSAESIVERLSDLEPGFYSELMVWNYFPEPIYSQSLKKDICGIAGTIDRAFIEPETVYIRDFKFPTEPLYDKPIEYKNFGCETHTDPWDSLAITKISGYKIQLNMYGWIAEQHGLAPRGLHLDIHPLSGKEGRAFDVHYLPGLAEACFDKVFIDSL